MILIADGGSTKTDWIALNQQNKHVFHVQTIGLNPNFMTQEEIVNEIKKTPLLKQYKEEVSQVFFYGSGCSLANVPLVKRALSSAFPSSNKNVIKNDLFAAAYSCFQGNPAVVCILGTGSNSFFFDGTNFREDMPSLGFLLGDEGSGNHLGKKITKAYFEKKLEPKLQQAFKEEYNLSLEVFMENLYKKPYPNRYLAAFSPFFIKHKEEPQIRKMIVDSFKSFFEEQVLVYPEAKMYPLNFTGSVAHYYEDILREVVGELGLSMGFLVKKPIEKLVAYHVAYLL